MPTPCPCEQTPNNCYEVLPCECAVKDLKTSCLISDAEPIPCLPIAKGLNFNEWTRQLILVICAKFQAIENAATNLINVGTGAGIFKGTNLLGQKTLRSLKALGNLVIVQQSPSTDEIDISIDTTALTTFIGGLSNTVSQTITNDVIDKSPSENVVFDALVLKADLASPTFSGTPSLPTGTTGVTQSAGNNSTALATTAFVTSAVNPVIVEAKYEAIVVPCSDLLSNLVAGTTVAYFRMPFAMTVTSVKASVLTAQTGSAGIALITFDINRVVGGTPTSILGAKITINNGSETSIGATAPPTITAPTLAIDDKITIDIDLVGAGAGVITFAKGAVITIIGTRT